MNYFTILAAEEVTTSAAGGAAGGCMQNSSWITTLILIIAMVALLFFSSRSQKKREKAIADMRNNIQVGDEITTIGGIIGKVVSIKEETCVIETSRDGTKMRILKSAISTVDVKAEDAQD